MYPEDRVLVTVLRRKRDFRYARDERWYRIPADRMNWQQVEYLAFFMSRAFETENGAVHWYAECRGWELARRRDLLPNEPNHPRADGLYYRIALGELIPRKPPIRNYGRYAISFIFTTGARFTAARSIKDLFGAGDYVVTRVYRGKR